MDEKIRNLAKSFEENGYGVIENFLDSEAVDLLRREAANLVESSTIDDCRRQVFGHPIHVKSDYFLTSGDKVRTFFEKGAVDLDNNKLLVEKEQSVAKIGHALHCLNVSFRRCTTSCHVRKVFEAIGFKDPTVVQSMLIFKNPRVGGEYTPHQDASFLCTEPIRLAGFWFALDDATEENGCLQFIPGSHKEPLARRFVRSQDEKTGEISLIWTASPAEYDDDAFVRVPVKRGSLVLIHGLVVHRSAPNQSDKPRWVYTFHAYDKNNSKYLEDNWLQEIDNKTFLGMDYFLH